MHRFEGSSPKELKILSNVLDYSGYYSMLTVYHSKISDNWMKVANIINLEHRLKYMIAIRTYAISPEYCAMMCEAFSEIDPHRLVLNIAAGDVQGDETSIEDSIEISHLISTHEDRVAYTSSWLKKFTSLEILRNKPEIVVSGTSTGTINNSNEYADAHLCMYSSYKDGLGKQITTKRKMVTCIVIIRDTKEEADAIYDSLPENMGKTSCLYGTEDEIINDILLMKNEGVTDVLVSRAQNDDQHYRIHSMVRKITEGR